MNYKERNLAINKMEKHDSNGSFMAQMCIDKFWSSEDIDTLIELWDIVHDPVDKVFAPYGIVDISERFMIPYRTVQNWYRGERECATWIRLLIRDAIDRETDMPRKGRVRRPKHERNED